MKMKTTLLVGALLASFLATPAFAQGARASTRIEASSAAERAVQEVAPSVLEGDVEHTSVKVTAEPSATSARETDPARPLEPQVVVTTTPEDSQPMSVAFTLDGTSAALPEADGVSTFLTHDASVSRLVTESSDGARVLTSYARPQASYESRTTFHLEEGEHAEERANGDWYLERGNDIMGVIRAPWALDARGVALQTRYRWEGSTLVQSVVVPDTAVFPVVADPAWSYTWTAVIRIGSPGDVHNKMTACFNCIFPVEGAPSAFPRIGQVLPLVVRPYRGSGLIVDFTCIFAGFQNLGPNLLFPNGDFGFWFDAGRGHVDGAGSNISFDWWTGSDPLPNEHMRFTVYGSIVNSNPAGLPRGVYATGAKTTWGTFIQTYVSRAGGIGDPFDWNWLN
jgi:hypothetical protein